jgi:hypothetical protein
MLRKLKTYDLTEQGRFLSDVAQARRLLDDVTEAAIAETFDMSYVRNLLREAKRACEDANRQAAFAALEQRRKG